MINKIENWTYDKPTEAGDYLACYGDVETEHNVEYIRVSHHIALGCLIDSNNTCISNEYGRGYKFARLIYSPSELKGLSDDV